MLTVIAGRPSTVRDPDRRYCRVEGANDERHCPPQPQSGTLDNVYLKNSLDLGATLRMLAVPLMVLIVGVGGFCAFVVSLIARGAA